MIGEQVIGVGVHRIGRQRLEQRRLVALAVGGALPVRGHVDEQIGPIAPLQVAHQLLAQLGDLRPALLRGQQLLEPLDDERGVVALVVRLDERGGRLFGVAGLDRQLRQLEGAPRHRRALAIEAAQLVGPPGVEVGPLEARRRVEVIGVGAERAPQKGDLPLDVAAGRALVGELDEQTGGAVELRLVLPGHRKIGRDVERRQRLLGDGVVRAQAHRLLEPYRGLAPVLELVGEHAAERDQDLAALVAARRRLQLDLVQAHHHRPVAERTIDTAAGVDGVGVVGIDLERALVGRHRSIDASEIGFVERAELEIDGGAQPRLGGALVGLGDGALVQVDGAEEIAALAHELRGLAIGIRGGSAA